jgi:hypothetical protein
MTGYQARWDNSPPAANALRTFARTIPATHAAPVQADLEPVLEPALEPFLAPVPDPEPTPLPEAAHAPEHFLPDPRPDVSPPADRIEPVLANPDTFSADDFSDLIALANGYDDDPLELRRAPHAADIWEHDGMARFLAASVDSSDPLAALMLEYRHALLSPKSGSAYDPGKTVEDHAARERAHPAIRAPHDPFAELVDPLHTEASVFDLLTKGKNIDTLLDSLDSFGAEQIFKANETHEILALLAPRGSAPHRAGRTARLAREEHHMISMDSHMAMPDSIENEEPEFSNETDR